MTRRPPMVAGNWKMNTTLAEGVALATAVSERCAQSGDVEVVVLPPFVHLWSVRQALARGIALGAQDVYWEDSGAYTGEVSPLMLAGLCDHVLVGHSERRHLFGETDDQVGRKFAAARRHGLHTIVAVGELESERDSGSTMAVVDRQLDAVLALATTAPSESEWVVAYEPVWAIGTGRTATPDQAEDVCAHIHDHLAAALDSAPRILYGGSVTADNAGELFGCAHIDGGLIGGASLRPDVFATIVVAAAG